MCFSSLSHAKQVAPKADSYYTIVGVGLPVRKITSGSILKYKPDFNVPALVPNFDIENCISLDYALKLDVGFQRISASSQQRDVVCTLTVVI